MSENEATALIDVRTRAEWSFVGVPDLSELGKEVHLVEWRKLPAMTVNGEFAQQVASYVGSPPPQSIFFICRSGARSMEAARMMADQFTAAGHAVRCVNVAEGFEGDLDENRHRGTHNGWKARGLAWRQS